MSKENHKIKIKQTKTNKYRIFQMDKEKNKEQKLTNK